jgi:hypothetical protein
MFRGACGKAPACAEFSSIYYGTGIMGPPESASPRASGRRRAAGAAFDSVCAARRRRGDTRRTPRPQVLLFQHYLLVELRRPG